VEEEEEKKGGIIIPETAKEKPQKGEVIAVGAGRLLKDGTHLSPSVKKGDVVLFSKYAGDEVEIDDEKYLIVSEDEILAVIS